MKFSIHPLTNPLPASVVAGAQIDQRLIYRLRVSLSAMLAREDALPTAFYRILFDRHPELRQLFPKDMTAQRAKLSQTLAWIVTYLDSHDQVLSAIGDLGRRHVAYGAAAEHYPMVRDALIAAMGEVSGEAWDAELAEDWRLSIDLITRHMIAAAATEGGGADAGGATKPAAGGAGTPPGPTSTTPR